MSSTLPAGRGPFAFAVYLSAAAVAGMVGLTASAGLVDSMPLATGVALAVASGVAWWLATHAGISRALTAVPRTFRLAFAAGALVVLAQLVPLTAFIIDPHVDAWTASAVRPWQSAHSCVSCYWVAAEKATRVPDLYDERIYRPIIPPHVTRRPNLGPFFVDVFEYPPTFLPLPRLLAWATPDFWGFRRLWFALNLAGVILGLLVVAHRVDTASGTHAIWLMPWALAAPSMIGTLQAGNVQLLVIVQAAVAMLLFERRRHALGGVLLGYAIVSKLYPGVLILYLLMRRDWRAVVWTAGASAAIAGVALVDVGWTPFAAFLEHLPRILSGEAFPGLSRPPAIAINTSIPGLAFKLGLFGVPGMDFAAAQVVGWVFTAILVVTIAWLALRSSDRGLEPLVWIAVLLLATLRSPFLPGYGPFPTFWLASLVMAVACARRSIGVAAAALWIVAAIHVGQGAVPPQVNAVLTFGHTLAALIVAFVLVPRVTAVPAAATISETAVPTTA